MLSDLTICKVSTLVPQVEWKPLAHGVAGFAMIESPHGVEGMIDAVLKHVEGTVGTVWLSNVVPGQEIPLHTDEHDDGCTRRIHVPLQTNRRARFFYGGGNYYFRKNKAYMINPLVEHGVFNGGKTDRIHLMFNVL